MKVHFKANKGYIYEADIPEFKDGKYLMGIARQAKDLLFKSYVELDYPSVKAAYDLLYEARKHYSPVGHTEFNQNTDTDLIEKGYAEYCKILDRIMGKLITAMWVTKNMEEEPEQDEAWAKGIEPNSQAWFNYVGKRKYEIREELENKTYRFSAADRM